MPSETAKNKDHSIEFLLKEYQQLHELSMASVSRSEQRVTFFLTISSGAIGVLLILLQTNSVSFEIASNMALSLLLILLAFGFTTLNRVIYGATERRVNRKLSEHIQSQFSSRDTRIVSYLELRKKLYERPKYRFGFIFNILHRLRGTLTDLMILSNSLICAGIVLASLSRVGYKMDTVIQWTIFSLVISMLLFYRYYSLIKHRLPPT